MAEANHREPQLLQMQSYYLFGTWNQVSLGALSGESIVSEGEKNDQASATQYLSNH